MCPVPDISRQSWYLLRSQCVGAGSCRSNRTRSAAGGGQPQVVQVQVTGLDALGEALLGQGQDRLVHRLVRNDERRGQHLQRSAETE